MSISGHMMRCVAEFRNPNGTEFEWARTVDRRNPNLLKVILAEVAYIAIIPFAIIETALSAIAKAFTFCLPLAEDRHQAMSNWLQSSAFCVAWSCVNVAFNLLFQDLIAYEHVAKACAVSGNFAEIPRDVLLAGLTPRQEG